MSKESVVRAYFQGLERGNYDDVIKLFAPRAIVYSPLYGKIEATQFYKEIFSDTRRSQIVLKNTFVNPMNPDVAAAHFVYAWTLKDGMDVRFECVDVFTFAPGSDLIISLTIIYDTYHTRKEFMKSKNTNC